MILQNKVGKKDQPEQENQDSVDIGDIKEAEKQLEESFVKITKLERIN